MTLTGVPSCGRNSFTLLAAVERGPVVFFRDRLFTPVDQAHDRCGRVRAALRSFALGAGGFSSNSITRRLSRCVSLTRSCSSMTDRRLRHCDAKNSFVDPFA